MRGTLVGLGLLAIVLGCTDGPGGAPPPAAGDPSRYFGDVWATETTAYVENEQLPGGISIWILKKAKDIEAEVGGPTSSSEERRSRSTPRDHAATSNATNGRSRRARPTARTTAPRSASRSDGARSKKERRTRSPCDVDVKLEVSGPAGDDADHGRVRVTPRDFRTKISPAQKVDVDVSSADGGRNRCAHDPIGGSNSHFLHRTNEGFEVRRVDDPDGPFAGAFFVASTDLELTRREEREIAYRGPSGAYFVGTGAPFNAQLQSQIEKHEAAHSDLMRDALERLRRQKRDPAQVMEKMASPDETRLRAAAGQAYFQTNREICQATQHPFVFRKLAELANVSGTIRDGSGNVIAIVSDLQTFANDDFTCD